MFRALLVLLGALSTSAYQVIFAINCGSSDRTIINTKFFNYTVDSYFEGLASMSQVKSSLPQSISNQADRQIIKSHRTASPGYTEFSYRPIIGDGYHIAIFSMIETEYRAKGERIFKIKLGDEIVHTVDVVSEAGYGKILHKWIEFDIREDVAFLNGTLPALNAFNYKTRQVKIVFQEIKNKPKIQGFIMLRGNDAHQFLRQFLQYEQQKNIRVKEYISEKYRRQPKLTYRPLQADDIIPPPQSQIYKLYKKYVTFRSVGSIICGILAVHHEKIIKYFIEKYKRWIQRVANKHGLNAKKKQ